jgi:Zn-dependent protease with chaperone function
MLPPNHPQTIRVRRIAAQLIATACECDDKSCFGFGGRRSLLERIRWFPVNGGGGVNRRVDVVVDDEVNVYSYHKGFVRVSTGFLGYMRTDAELAVVLGHEVAHVIARHGLQRRRNSFWVGFLVNFAAELLNVPRDRFTEDNWEFIFIRPCYFR